MPIKYKIKIDYSTGNSFGSEDTYSHLEMEWENIDVVQANLKRIEEHYKMYQELSRYGLNKRKREDIEKDNINKDWFVNNPKLFGINKLKQLVPTEEKHKHLFESTVYRPDVYYYEHCIKLKTDAGNDWQISAFWVGYFEHLNSAEIEIDDKSMKITF